MHGSGTTGQAWHQVQIPRSSSVTWLVVATTWSSGTRSAPTWTRAEKPEMGCSGQEYMQLLVLRGSKHLKNQSLQVALSLREEGVPPSPITAVQADIWNTRSWTLGRRKVMANQVGLRSGLQSPRGKKQEKLGRRGRSTKENSVRCLDCLQRIWCWMLRWVLGKGEAKCISRTHQKLISKPSSLMNKS